MANKKPDSRNTNPVDRKRDEGAPVPRIQPIIKPDRERGAPIPSIQPITQPPAGSQPADVPPPANPKPIPDSEPAANTPKPTGTESSK